jgi:protein-tyrosine-phosphatase
VKRVLFVCVENSNRSQMAEAFARIHGADVVEAASAGSRPSGRISPKAIATMAEKGYDLRSHHSKGLDQVGPGPWDYVVTMGCGDECPLVPTRARLDWDLTDPRDLPESEVREVRDRIEGLVLQLLKDVRLENQ